MFSLGKTADSTQVRCTKTSVTDWVSTSGKTGASTEVSGSTGNSTERASSRTVRRRKRDRDSGKREKEYSGYRLYLGEIGMARFMFISIFTFTL